jgi:hypothetical protein
MAWNIYSFVLASNYKINTSVYDIAKYFKYKLFYCHLLLFANALIVSIEEKAI